MIKRLSSKQIIVIFVLVAVSFIVYKRDQRQQNEPQRQDQKIIVIGNNTSGQLGVSPNSLEQGKNVVDSIDKPIAQIASGRNYSLALSEDGSLWVWGGNDLGQLGMETETGRVDSPIEIALRDIKSVSASNNHTMILKNDGTVWTTGSNFSGQLGDGGNTDSKTPKEVKGISDVTAIAAGYKFSAALKKDGTVWAWGASCSDVQKRESEEWWKALMKEEEEEDEKEGGYYDPNSDALATYDKNEYCINEDVVGILSKVPVQIKNLTNIVSISAGYGHVLALTADGKVFSFGCNTYKQLGRTTLQKSDNAAPELVEGLPRIKKVIAGYRHSFALSEDGALWGWGDNDHGQLGNGGEESVSTPTKLPTGNIKDIMAGYDYTFIVKDDGSVWGWGRNTSEWFGDTTIPYVTTPKKIDGLENIRQIAVGGAHLLALSEK